MNDSTPITFSRHGPEGTGLTELEGIPAEALVSGTPVLSGYNYFTDDTGKLTAGVWHATPFTDHPVPSPVNEFMLVLEGSVTIVHDNGSEETIRAGQSFVVPKGMPHSWHSTQDVRKFYATFDDDSGEELDAGALVVRRPDPAAHLDPMDEQDTSRYVGRRPRAGHQSVFPGRYRADARRRVVDHRDAHQAAALPEKRAHAHRRGRGHDHRRRRPGDDLRGRRHLHGAQGHDLPVGQHRHGEEDFLHLPAQVVKPEGRFAPCP